MEYYEVTLFEETVNALKDNGKDVTDVEWVSVSRDGERIYFTWDEFKEISCFMYDNSYGAVQVDWTLIVVGSDFWLEREEALRQIEIRNEQQ